MFLRSLHTECSPCQLRMTIMILSSLVEHVKHMKHEFECSKHSRLATERSIYIRFSLFSIYYDDVGEDISRSAFYFCATSPWRTRVEKTPNNPTIDFFFLSKNSSILMFFLCVLRNVTQCSPSASCVCDLSYMFYVIPLSVAILCSESEPI